ncbi:hypothetical protein OV208_27020 [Corallococcus sp. bb12-1]|uniref:hypothetical protein n=1 Tax=Corallococcus sp. bb12-1 TaxID=2996784 RepID=UPI00226E33A3|nr:hypothetical protein [Corallococcus sp. bb12-1]MCY1044996.1 hypothetical protein [Corallococcus sp. bb12-1]
MSTTSVQIQFHRPNWWGFEVHLNQRAVDVLTTLEGFIADVVGNFLPTKVSIAMDLYIRVRHLRIERASRGQGVRLVSPWPIPLMLTPRPLNHPSSLGDTALRWSVSEVGATLGAWSSPELFPNHHSATSPALAVFGDQLVCVQRGIGNDEGLSWMAYDPETGWSDVTRIGTQASRASPALATYNNQLHCVYRGSGNNQRLYWTIFNGSSWSPGQPLPHDIQSDSSPALASCGDSLYCLYRRPGGGATRLMWTTHVPGFGWRAPRELPHNMLTSTGPALVALLGANLVCAYQSPSDQRLLWTEFNGHVWTPPQRIGVAMTPNTPTLVNVNGNVLCIHRGTGDNILWASTLHRHPSIPHGTWSEWWDTGLRSAAEPALVVYRDKNVDSGVNDQIIGAFRGE